MDIVLCLYLMEEVDWITSVFGARLAIQWPFRKGLYLVIWRLTLFRGFG